VTRTTILQSDVELGTPGASSNDTRTLIETTSSATETPTRHIDAEGDQSATLTDKDLYPHLFDESSGVSAAQALAALRSAVSDLEEVSELLTEPDFQSAWAALGSAGAKIKRAEQFSSFNSALRGICIYCRRAVHQADATQLDQQAVQAMILAIGRLADNPTISLSSAGELADSLEIYGWNGNNPIIEEIAEALFNSNQQPSIVEAEKQDAQ
jgi:hypothetical protein